MRARDRLSLGPGRLADKQSSLVRSLARQSALGTPQKHSMVPFEIVGGNAPLRPPVGPKLSRKSSIQAIEQIPDENPDSAHKRHKSHAVDFAGQSAAKK